MITPFACRGDNFGQTVAAGALNVLFTAILVTLIGGIAVSGYQARIDKRRREAEAREEKRRREAEAREEDRRREAEAQHEKQLQAHQLEYQTRAALRETYADFLVAQRRSREASVKLAKAGTASPDRQRLEEEAVLAHADFINLYHRLNLDADRPMWKDARSLRKVLDDMLKEGKQGNDTACEALAEVARKARQNLERSFRIRLEHKPLQKRKDVGTYDRREDDDEDGGLG